MTPIRTNKTNDVLGVSPKQAAAGVRPLPIERGDKDEDPPTVASDWVLSDQDIEALKANGGIVTIRLWGKTHPPLALVVDPDRRARR
jgi:hypothetical protein